MAGETPAPPSSVAVVDCPNCGSGVQIRAQGRSLTAVCRSCFAVLDCSTPELKILQESQKRTKFVPLIPIGKRGKVHGELYEVIGYMVRSDHTGVYEWEEYLLFNPYKGFRWLTQMYGHWNYVLPLKNKAREYDDSATHLNRSYRQFLNGSAKVQFVLGEFYWRVKTGDETRVIDFIHPPEILSKEWDKFEEIWSLGTYIEGEELRKAFGLETPLPSKTGIAPNQPSDWGPVYASVRNMALVGFAALFAIQLVYLLSASNEVVYRQAYPTGSYEYGKTIVTPSFDLNKNRSNVAIYLRSPVNNNWLEAELELVNDGNGESMSFEQGVEYWSGYDWSEGSQRSDIMLSEVPGGRYHLAMDVTSGV
ncbi:MAG TPA: DUF4178 domain-containing protein, partial [Bdellovibrionales bacterium]|nr:DUF4178 domain-containing protein [Bdellovibrionales bacterium]